MGIIEIDKEEIEFMMKFFDLDEVTVREAYENAHNLDDTMKILMRKSEEKNN